MLRVQSIPAIASAPARWFLPGVQKPSKPRFRLALSAASRTPGLMFLAVTAERLIPDLWQALLTQADSDRGTLTPGPQCGPSFSLTAAQSALNDNGGQIHFDTAGHVGHSQLNPRTKIPRPGQPGPFINKQAAQIRSRRTRPRSPYRADLDRSASANGQLHPACDVL